MIKYRWIPKRLGTVDFSLSAIGKEVRQVASDVAENHLGAALAGCALVTAGTVAVIASRGRLLSAGATLAEAGEVLPGLELAGGASRGLSATGEALAGSAGVLRQPTLAEIATGKVFGLTTKTRSVVMKALYGAEAEAPAGVQVSDEVRKTVFNRFLSRLDQEKYLVHGSYPLETQGYIVRKAVKDLDLLSTDASLIKATGKETSSALLKDLQAMVGKPGADGMSFEISEMAPETGIKGIFYPRMHHGFAIAKGVDGAEIMRIPLDLRVGAGTILPPISQTLKVAGETAQEGATVVKTMQPEEQFASKLYTYTNRTVGGLKRKPKDLRDMANMVETGLDQGKVTEALQAWTKRGYSMGPMRHPGEILGSTTLGENMAGQTVEQLDRNYNIVQNYYRGLVPKVEGTQLMSDVNLSPLAQISRFFQKQFVVYPAG